MTEDRCVADLDIGISTFRRMEYDGLEPQQC